MEPIGTVANRLISTAGASRTKSRTSTSPDIPIEAAALYWAEVRRGMQPPEAVTEPICPVCGGLRHVRDEAAFDPSHANFGKLFPCPACLLPGLQEKYVRDRCNLSEEEQRRSFEDFWTSTVGRIEALKAARDIQHLRRDWLTLWGDYGSGKSYLASAIVAECARRKIEARYWLMESLLDHLRDAFNPNRGQAAYSNLFADLVACPVLVVDECHAFNPTPWAESKFRQLAVERDRQALTTATVWVLNAEPKVGNAAAPAGLDFLFSRMSRFPIVRLDGDVRPKLAESRARDGLTVEVAGKDLRGRK